MKKTVFLSFAILANAFVGGVLAAVVGVAPWIGAAGLNILAAVLPRLSSVGGLCATVYTEVWTGEVVKRFNALEQGTFMDGIPDLSRYANNDVIHLVDAGVDPDVLINNSTYPIPLQSLDDTDITISLDKYSTKTTPITDDELFAISYDKIALVKEKHATAIATSKLDKSIHAFAPAANSAATPVIFTTGAQTGTRLALTRADIISLKKAFDTAKVPVAGRRLVLCPDHVEDLLLTDQKFAEQYYNYSTGKIANLYGFAVYEYVNNPLYTQAGNKKQFGVAAAAGEYQASVAFYAPRMVKVNGTTKMYYSEAKTDTEYHRNKVNFETRYISLPKKQEAIGAIVSKYKAAVAG